MNQINLIKKFQATLPAVRKWIDQTLAEYGSDAVSVADLSFPRLSSVFPPDLLARAKAVVVSGKVPFPPLSCMGLSEFAHMEEMPAAGITFKDTYFLHHRDQSASLHFHELVHVVQWERLGVDSVDSITEAGPNLNLAKRDNRVLVDSILERLRISSDRHQSVGVAVVGHQNCAGNSAPRD
jgi:hypothetical protein